MMITSDGMPLVDGVGHPRGVGTNARVLGRYTRDQQLMPLMTALEKMTILPARSSSRISGIGSFARK